MIYLKNCFFLKEHFKGEQKVKRGKQSGKKKNMAYVKVVKNKAYFKRYQVKYRRRRGTYISRLPWFCVHTYKEEEGGNQQRGNEQPEEE
ncbi:60S ribosomal protein L5, putative [Plasmodium ovale curtisi]|uniref:60S ribosomal protein L5, putative n=1 Tax=Plasmodium ovale curtisi TaxID=864141 RepID=A0A1A8XCD9_PLAOA|nr:60S ribosomal protein L5, putative [Plasmodium ovale curtisi]